ncbi:MAG: hypothetical protein K2X47_06655 [Bdellovibrionales bacterium]|nr:hypothetical protein [Bdellovibrionales bacterium]
MGQVSKGAISFCWLGSCFGLALMHLNAGEAIFKKLWDESWTARLKWLLQKLRQCAMCGRGLVPVDPLCSKCWDLHFKLQMQKSLVFPEGADLGTTMALLAWPAGDLTTARLVLSFKNGFFESGIRKLAAEFIRITDQNQFLSQNHPERNFVIVPAPPRKEGSLDHAAIWARALSELVGAPVQEVLVRDSLMRDQRFLKRRERASVKLLLQSGVEVGSEKIYIFVDDVMTSGATFRAARRALRGSRAVWGWFIAYRT